MFGGPRGTKRDKSANVETLARAHAAEKERDDAKAALEKMKRERDAARDKLAELRPLRCSFCAKTHHEVRKMIAGPSVFICDECVDVCARIVSAEASPALTEED
ncbi:ClpX C4-type zinc finger protein [Marinibacterium profundimaris]|uniref:ClpX-type ZB domain-containing protein n=1 Tax=Marinibacterium profundimaris TaxID=1679460 RepID=A0A225NW78_9RHOB|nr:hypothetical protein ATO3_02800 [Marinibacterium profundimaris]